MVNGGADDGEPERGVNRLVKGKGLQWNVTLVMVHAYHAVIFLASGGQEYGIRGEGTGDIDASTAGLLQGGGDYFLLLTITEETVFSSMGIEPTAKEPWFPATDTFHCIDSELNDVENSLFREQGWNFSVTNVCGYKYTTNLLGILEHAGSITPCPGSKDFGVSGEGDSGQVKGFLVERVVG